MKGIKGITPNQVKHLKTLMPSFDFTKLAHKKSLEELEANLSQPLTLTLDSLVRYTAKVLELVEEGCTVDPYGSYIKRSRDGHLYKITYTLPPKEQEKRLKDAKTRLMQQQADELETLKREWLETEIALVIKENESRKLEEAETKKNQLLDGLIAALDK